MWYTAAWGVGQLEQQQQQQGLEQEEGDVLRESLSAVAGYLEEGESCTEIPDSLGSPEGETGGKLWCRQRVAWDVRIQALLLHTVITCMVVHESFTAHNV
jgi:hypothetical protein